MVLPLIMKGSVENAGYQMGYPIGVPIWVLQENQIYQDYCNNVFKVIND